MIKSMTGYGNAKERTPGGFASVEIKSINHRFLEVSCRLPGDLSSYEDKIQGLIKKKIIRGKLYFNLIEEGIINHVGALSVDMELAKKYYNKLKKVKKTFNLDKDINLKDIVSFPGIVSYKISEKDILKIWPMLEKIINKALDKLIKTREREGRYLKQDLNKRLKIIAKSLKIIDSKSFKNVKAYKRKLEKKIKEISGISAPSNERLEIEVALFAKNSDISEEITRLLGHLDHFAKVIKKAKEIGKTLDFLAQEMHREANTIGAKSNDATISSNVIEMKSAIEKIREQVKNIE